MRLFCTTCRVLRCVLACSGRIRFVNNANHRGTNYIYNFYIFLHVGALIVKFNIRVLRKKSMDIFTPPSRSVLDTFPWHLPQTQEDATKPTVTWAIVLRMFCCASWFLPCHVSRREQSQLLARIFFTTATVSKIEMETRFSQISGQMQTRDC